MTSTVAASPVWVRGRAVERRKRSLLLVCLNARLVECRLVLPRSQLRGERECRAEPSQREFLVPAWWAKAASLEPTPTSLNDVDYSALELRLLAQADAVLPDGRLVVYKTKPGPNTGRNAQFELYSQCLLRFKPGTRG